MKQQLIKVKEIRETIRKEIIREDIKLDKKIGHLLHDLDSPLGLLASPGQTLMVAIDAGKEVPKQMILSAIGDLVRIYKKDQKEKFLYPDEKNELVGLLKKLNNYVGVKNQ